MTAPALLDCHSDVMIDVHRRRQAGERNVLGSVHLPRLRQGGVGACVCTVGGDVAGLCPRGIDRPYESALELLEELAEDAAESGGAVAVASSAAALRDLLAKGVLALVPCFEGASPLEGKLERIELFARLGVRSIGLTWNSRNELATGVGVEGGGGLTPRGIEAVAEMNRVGILVDVSHLSPSGFWDVARASSAPFFASHANARALCDHVRNLDDEQLDAVAACGGIVGVVLYPGFVGPRPTTLAHVLDHVEYLASRIGVEAVAIGADFVDYALDLVGDELRASGVGYEEADLAFPAGLEDCRSLGNLLEGMRGRGFAEPAVAMIAGENFIRLLEANEPARPAR